VQEAETVFRVSQVSYDAAMKSVVYQVKQDYYTLLGDQDTVVLRQATVTQAAENLALYQGLFARTTRHETGCPRSAGRADTGSTRRPYLGRTGRDGPEEAFPGNRMALEKAVQRGDSPLPDPPALGAAEALKSAFQNRSELPHAGAEHRRGRHRPFAPEEPGASRLFSLTASLGVGQDWTANVNAGFFTAGVSIALPPILDGGLQDALVQQAADQLAAYKVQQAQQGQSIAIDVVNALLASPTLETGNALAAQNLQQAQGQYDLEKGEARPWAREPPLMF